MEIDSETVTVCHEEVVAGLTFLNSLTAAQQAVAIESSTKSNESMKAGAFSDNTVQEYTGLRGSKFTTAQKKKRLGIVEVFVGRAKADVAEVRMAEVRKHLDNTYVTWAGGTADDSAFYVRVHSPVIWVEVDARFPVRLRARTAPPRAAARPRSTFTPSSARPTATTTERSSSGSTT
ncbi:MULTISPECIES: DUF3500 domain-containing protein [Streptomyces]|uniref:DUF3500 domain-containing protein n=2 Tax=Streptomyces TaxID=1883 RepID=A0ABV9J804_9ACTN